jgi:hypothetical protein
MKAWNVKIRDSNNGKILDIVLVHGYNRISARSLALDHYCIVNGSRFEVEACEASPNKKIDKLVKSLKRTEK